MFEAPHGHYGHSALLLQALAPVLERIGVEGAQFLRDVGVEEGMDGATLIDAARVDEVLARVAAVRGDPALSITLAHAESRGPLGLYGHLVWLSGTLRDAIGRGARFYSLVTRRATLSLETREGDPLARVARHARARGAGGKALAEFVFTSMMLRARAATEGRFVLRAMRFAHAGPDPAPYEAFFGAPVTFGESEVDEMVFDTSLLDLPLATADPITLAALEAQAARMNTSAAGRSPLLDEVRRAAAEAPEGRASLPAIARRVGVGERSLRRRLAAEESVTVREVVDSVRRERARELLDAGRPVKEVAFLLGFSEPSAFSRAYKRWTGAAPKGERGRAKGR
jgi:AraC-like DNA-binding protein